MKYHIDDNGTPKVCDASYGNCPYGTDAPHFDNKADAHQYYEKVNTLEEIPAGLSKKKSKSPMMVSVYRAGRMRPASAEESFEDLERVKKLFDDRAPEGRQKRSGALFASPDLKSHSRWVGSSGPASLTSHEFKVDANNVYIYNVNLYENASYTDESESIETVNKMIDDYWNSGMTLAQWHQMSEEEKGDYGSWEILLPSDREYKTKKVPNKTVITESDPSLSNQLNWSLEKKRARNGLIWRKSHLSEDDYLQVKQSISSENIDEEFIEDMESIHKSNAYRVEDLYSARMEIYNKYKNIRKKKDDILPNYSQINDEQKDEFFNKVEVYLKKTDDFSHT